MGKKSSRSSRASDRRKTSINLSEDSIDMIDKILSAEGGYSRSSVIERAVRAFFMQNEAVRSINPGHEAK